MEPKENVFVFDSYSVASNKKEIQFSYKYKDLRFVEKIILPEAIPDSVNQELLAKVLENLHLILGISYFKMHLSKQIVIPYSLTKDQADFWNTVYTKGLGEFFYKNQIDYKNLINFPVNNQEELTAIDSKRKDKVLLGIGGGKDSVVAFELLKAEKEEITGFILDSQEASPQVQIEVAKTMGIGCLVVKRKLDQQLFDLKSPYNGHIPITAAYSFVALLLAVIYDYSTIIIPNGKSANFGNVNYLGQEINHQWSKSEEFEKLFQEYIKKYMTTDINYFSNLRNYSEMEIAKMFSSYEKYFSVFSSCNKNFKIKPDAGQKRWCGKCAKCAFVFTILAANLSKDEVVGIFNKNLLNDAELIPLYGDLIGKGTMKPFDCVGTFEESQDAFRIIKSKGEFDDDIVIKTIGELI